MFSVIEFIESICIIVEISANMSNTDKRGSEEAHFGNREADGIRIETRWDRNEIEGMSLCNGVLRHTVTLVIQGRILVQNLFTIYIVKEINACSLSDLFVLNNNSTLDE